MVANGIAAAYSLLQVLRCVVSMVRGNLLFSKPLAWAIFSGDQVHCILDSFMTLLLDQNKKYCTLFLFFFSRILYT